MSHRVSNILCPLAFLLAVLLLPACEPAEEWPQADGPVQLSFSADTVFFDTVFTTMGSITRRLRVYNRGNRAVEIDRIALAGAGNSPFSLVINGQPGNLLEKIRLIGGDSLLILATVRIDPADKDRPFLVRDSVLFQARGTQQHVKLWAWGQDAVFLRGRTLVDSDTEWSPRRPYVIFDTLLVGPGATLNLPAGTELRFADRAVMLVAGTLRAEGTTERPVRLLNLRKDPPFDRTAGQWRGLIFLQASQRNLLRHTHLLNATTGIYLGTPDANDEPDLVLEQVLIENTSIAGLVAYTSDLLAVNTVINNSAGPALACLAGGNYTLLHCTLANYAFDFFREEPSFVFSNFEQLTAQVSLHEPFRFTAINTVMDGALPEEFLFRSRAGQPFQLDIRNSLLRTRQNGLQGNNNLISVSPRFKGEPGERNFTPDEGSPLIGSGLPLTTPLTDFLGRPRKARPDIGAIEVQ